VSAFAEGSTKASGAVRLAAVGLSKSFGATRALSNLSFTVRAGEVHALCGENGAGKSTLIKVLSGIYPHGSFAGEVQVDGRVAAFQSVRDAEQAGIVVIHQELALVPELSAAENVFLGHEPTRFGLIDSGRMIDDTRALLARFGVAIDATQRVRELGVGQAQLLEIARALHKRARVLILDEPTAALSEREVAALLNVLRDLKQQGVAIVYVSHRLNEVFALADRITVLRDGASIVTMDARDSSEAELVRHMVGRELSLLFPRRNKQPGAPLLRVNALSASGRLAHGLRLHDISLTLHAGEVLGIGGLVGAGRSELLLHLFGAWGTRTSGTVELAGEPLQSPSPSHCIRRGLVLVSEDRKQQGLVIEQSVGFNLSLAHLSAFARLGLVQAEREQRAQRSYVERLKVKTASLALPVSSLSGGNQQKVVLGKALMTEPKVVLLDEPTRGVDVGAKAEIYALIAELCEQGLGVLLVTSELSELLGLADRIVMLVEGRVGGTFDRAEATEERLLAAALSRTTSPDPRADHAS
jgi:D-xylose transport system ATP-binding protein